ncbi:MAG: hypothetical protein KA436_00090 [Oligoflexales bacterium]|nr:hypothetical protein [Oligoflexales bacterium]
MPTWFGPWLYCDLLTTWLCIVFVHASAFQAVYTTILTVLLLETHGASPFGLYLCFYWILGSLIFLLRSHISWQKYSPWLSLITCAQLFFVCLEGLVHFSKVGNLAIMDSGALFYPLVRVLASVLGGWLLSYTLVFKVQEGIQN